MELYRKVRCRYCESPLPKEPFLDLGVMALANSFLTPEEAEKEEFICPLRLARCSACGLVQLCDAVPPKLMFANYLYVSSTTQTFRRHFEEYAKAAKARLMKDTKSVVAVDIGSNDGLLLSCYQREGMKAVGVEPAKNLCDAANQGGFATLNEYFGAKAVEKILKDFGPADIVSGNNVFAHIDDIHDVLRNVHRLLSPQGFFVIEFPYLVVMMDRLLFDMVYHEHLSYIALGPLQRLLERFGLEIFSIEEVASHGGSLRVFIQKRNAGRPIGSEVEGLLQSERMGGYDSFEVYDRFAARVGQVKKHLIQFITKIKSEGKSISGYGAPAKGNTLINYCALTAADITYIVDDNPLKQGRLAPGSHIPVVPSKHLFEHVTDYVLILAWNFSEEIIKKLQPLKQKGVRFIVPLPEPRTL